MLRRKTNLGHRNRRTEGSRRLSAMVFGIADMNFGLGDMNSYTPDAVYVHH